MNYNQHLTALFFNRLMQVFNLSSAGVWQTMDDGAGGWRGGKK